MLQKNKNMGRFALFRYVGIMLLLCCVGMFCPSWAGADGGTIYVNGTTGNDGNSGSSLAEAYKTLGKALEEVNAGDTIKITPGIYTSATGYTIDKNLTVEKNDTTSDQVYLETTTGTTDKRVLTIQATTDTCEVTLRGLTIQKGTNEWGGGGIYLAAKHTLTMENCTIKDNNTSTSGGGIYIAEGEDDNNTSCTMTDCTISGNSASSCGGGIYASDNISLTMTNCTISGNSATNDGGGIHCINRGDISLTNCTLYGNSTESDGGAISSGGQFSNFTLVNCTLANNSAEGTGGGFLFSNAYYGDIILVNSILWGNTDSSESNPQIAKSRDNITFYGTFSINHCVIQGGCNEGTKESLFTTTPDLKDLADNGGGTWTCALGGGSSSAVDNGLSPGTHTVGGTTITVPGKDQRDIDAIEVFASRFSIKDIGAYEYVPPKTVYVDKEHGSDDTGDGTAENPYQTLQAALDAENTKAGDTIELSAGTYTNTTGYTLDKKLTLQGKTGDEVILQAEEAPDTATSSVITIATNEDISLSNLTIRHGKTTGNGGGINGGEADQGKGALKLTDCTISDNKATSYGAGIYKREGKLTMTNCTVSNNTGSEEGGGICCDGGSFTKCTISGNSAEAGGGIENNGATLTLDKCTLSGNSVETAERNTSRLSRKGNAIHGGGGILNHSDSTVTLINCTLSGNSALDSMGGALLCEENGTLVLTNCTISGNSAKTGGGLYNKDGVQLTGINCIFWGNTDEGTNLQIQNNDDGQVTENITYCVIQEGTADEEKHILTGDPKLEALGDNGGSTRTCALGAGSSALDAGQDTGSTVTGSITVPYADQRGTSRPQPSYGGSVDMGAVEMKQGTLKVTLTPDAAVTAGAKWSADGGGTWNDSGASLALIPGSYTVSFKDVANHTKPEDQEVAITAGTETTKTGTYTSAAPAPSNPTATPTPMSIPTATPIPQGTPVPTVSPRPLGGDIQPGLTIVPTPNEEDPVVQELKDELNDSESASRKELESTIQEQVQAALEEKLGREINLDNLQVNVYTSDAYRFENVPLSLDDGTGTVIVPVKITYREPGEEEVEIFFTLVLVYDLTTTPPTPLEYRMVMLEEGNGASMEDRDIAFIRAEDTNEENLVGYLQVRDQSEYDGNPRAGVVSTKYMFLYADGYEGTPAPENPTPTGSASGGGGGGCGLGFFPLALLLALPLMLLKK